MTLPILDTNFLNEQYPGHIVSSESNMINIVLPQFDLPFGFNQNKSDLLLRLSPGYPDIPPDMWWFAPAIHRRDQQQIQATNHYENLLGRNWQRWSRHLESGQWQPGTDSVRSYLSIVWGELEFAVRGLTE